MATIKVTVTERGVDLNGERINCVRGAYSRAKHVAGMREIGVEPPRGWCVGSAWAFDWAGETICYAWEAVCLGGRPMLVCYDGDDYTGPLADLWQGERHTKVARVTRHAVMPNMSRCDWPAIESEDRAA